MRMMQSPTLLALDLLSLAQFSSVLLTFAQSTLLLATTKLSLEHSFNQWVLLLRLSILLHPFQAALALTVRRPYFHPQTGPLPVILHHTQMVSATYSHSSDYPLPSVRTSAPVAPKLASEGGVGYLREPIWWFGTVLSAFGFLIAAV